MKEEIVEGLKNAIAHGASLDEAVKSFLAAGYSPNDVNEAALSLTSGALSLTSQQAQPLPSPSQPPQAVMSSQIPSSFQPPQEKKTTPKWIKISIIILLLLIIIMGFVMLITNSKSS